MKRDKQLVVIVAVGLIAVLAGGALIGTFGPASAHEEQSQEGYELTFGGADEPLITGERMWLELEIVENETGEPVENQSETLNISVEKEGHGKKPLSVSERFGESGWYEAPVLFTEPGEYIIHVEGTIEGTDIHVHFEKTVHDRTELEYPKQTPRTNTTDSRGDDTGS